MNHAKYILKCAERSWESAERSEVILIITIGNWTGSRNLAEHLVDSAERTSVTAELIAYAQRKC